VFLLVDQVVVVDLEVDVDLDSVVFLLVDQVVVVNLEVVVLLLVCVE